MAGFLRRRGSAAFEGMLLAVLISMLVLVAAQDRTIVAAAGERSDGAREPAYGELLAEAIGQPPAAESLSARVDDRRRSSVAGVLSFAQGDDFAHGRTARTDYFVTDGAGTLTNVRFANVPSAGLQGAHVRITGIVKSGVLVADAGSVDGGAGLADHSASTGPHRVALILVNFSNDPSEPYTREFARGVAFTNSDSVAAYYAESSWGRIELTGDVYGWYTIPATNTACNYSQWSASANEAAAMDGVVLSDYDKIVYAFPTSTACGWAGLATMPGSYSWLNGPNAMVLRTMAHELGHNFGTHHASSLVCSESGIRVSLASGSNCALGEYGDPYSVMGGASRYHPTTFSRGNFGWLLNENSQIVTASGDFTLAPAEVWGVQVTTIRVPRTDTSWFALEFRQPYGTEFERMAATSPVATGVTIRITGAALEPVQSQLVDANPATTSFIDAPLAAGQTLQDPLTGTSISTLAVSPAGAMVRICE